MAWIRQLPSGKWAATVRTPAGRITETFRLKKRAEGWASDLESDVRRGDFIDPRGGEITVGEWWERVKNARRLELASRKRDASHWRVHVAPRWAHVQMGAILKPDVSAWVTEMDAAHKSDCANPKKCRGCLVGAATIQGAVGVLRGLLEQAVDARLIRVNPAVKVPMPKMDAHIDRILAPHEDALLLDSLDRQFPGRPDGRLFVETMLYCGLRYEEAAAIDRDHVDMRRQLIHVGPVLESDGNIRPYPKSPAGIRPVPVDADIWPRFRTHVLTVRPGGLVFTAARGGVLLYQGWYRRVWHRGLFEVTSRGKNNKILATRQVLDDPLPTPHDLRHTYGTRLAEQGVPVHEIMRLLGHENLQSSQRYLHAGEARLDRARQAMRDARGL